MDKFNQLLRKEGVLILDSALGTYLKSSSKEEVNTECFDLLTVTEPKVILEFHRQNIENGSNIITTNTFQASRLGLKLYGDFDEGQILMLNHEAVRIAKEATLDKPDTLVAGSIGPIQSVVYDNYQGYRDTVNSYKTQILAMSDAGVDLFLLETMCDILNVKVILDAIKEVYLETKVKLPTLVSFVVNPETGDMLKGNTIFGLVKLIESYDVQGIGVNCTYSNFVISVLSKLKRLTKLPILFYPSSDQTVDELYLHDIAASLLETNTCSVIGGCCGTTPAFIKKLRGLKVIFSHVRV